MAYAIEFCCLSSGDNRSKIKILAELNASEGQRGDGAGGVKWRLTVGALCVILGAWSWDTKKVREFGSLRRAGFEEAHLVARLLGVGLAEHERGGDGRGALETA